MKSELATELQHIHLSQGSKEKKIIIDKSLNLSHAHRVNVLLEAC